MGYNVSIPLPESVDGRRYEAGHEKVLGRIRRFAPAFVVLCLGLDTSKKDPTGSWDLSPADFEDSGRAVGRLKIPVLVVQEGGYNTRTLGQCAVRFFGGCGTACSASERRGTGRCKAEKKHASRRRDDIHG